MKRKLRKILKDYNYYDKTLGHMSLISRGEAVEAILRLFDERMEECIGENQPVVNRHNDWNDGFDTGYNFAENEIRENVREKKNEEKPKEDIKPPTYDRITEGYDPSKTKKKGCKYIKDEWNGDGDCDYETKILCEECKYGKLGGRKDPEAKCNQLKKVGEREMRVYLAGYIHGEVLNKCVAWRKQIREFYENYKGNRYPIDWLDPLNGKDLESISSDGLISSCSSNVIIHRDYQSVIRSDLIVVNTDTFGQNRPLTGTVAELAWAWEHHIPIIMITTEKKYKEHPFIKAFVSDFVESVDELLEKKLINLFYKGWNNAEY